MKLGNYNLTIEKVKESRINQLNQDNIQFGKLYADHMLVADYYDGQWQTVEIKPFANLSLSPATTFIHYGQSIFEGVKAYKTVEGSSVIFRPEENWKRMNVSAKRMGMPDVPQEIFIDGLKALLDIDKDWIPNNIGTSLYIRPFLFAVDEFIGVKPAEHFQFMIITSPAGPYYSKPVKIYVQDEYIRAAKGGIGFTKAAGNYGACMYPTMEIRAKGFDQNLWLDAVEMKYVQEIGTMNFFVVIDGKVLTPDLNSGTILAGVTRMSVLQILKDNNIPVEERPITIDEIVEAHHNGTLQEAFGTGTAASIAPIASLNYKGELINLKPEAEWTIIPYVLNTMNDIRYGRMEDKYQWLTTL